MIKAVVFDLGGTLMEYIGMPLNWEEFYYRGFQNVNLVNALNLSEEEILEAVKVLKEYNPRNNGREYEVDPEIIFGDATVKWRSKPEPGKIIDDFFFGMSLEARIFDHTIGLIDKCKKSGFSVERKLVRATV